MSAPPPLLLLVGMHRSGTSLLGSLLAELAIPLPGPLIEGDSHNPEGYYERADITDLQEQLLIDLGHWWPSQQGVLDLPPGWLDHPATLAVAGRLRQLLAAEMDRQPGAWAIKDPRSSLLLPLWRQIAAELELPLKLVLCVRHPAEVAASLLRRDRKAAGMTAWRAQQLWWRHTSQVLLEGRELPLQVVHYGHWFAAPAAAARQLRHLARFGRGLEPTPEEERRALARVRPEHRRSLADPLRLIPIHPRLGQLEEQLLALAEGRLKRHTLAEGLAHSPQPISLPLSERRHGTAATRSDPLQPGEHPWAAAALARHGGHHGRARRQLEHWRAQGTLSAGDLAQISLAPAAAFPLLGGTVPLPVSAAEPVSILCHGERWSDWPLHAWLQHLPLELDPGRCLLQEAGTLPDLPAQPDGAPEAPELRLGLHWQSIAASAEQHALEPLAALAAVFDRDGARVEQLRRLGVRAHRLQPGIPNAWLRQPHDDDDVARRLGLPAPAALGREPGGVLGLGSGGPDWEASLRPPCWGVPGFDQLHLDGTEDARLLAGWLDRCQAAGLQLLRFDATDSERRLEGFAALRPPPRPPAHWLPAQLFARPLAVEAVEEELRWRQDGCPAPPPCHTPTPAFDCLWEQDGGTSGAARAAVAISLHDYADRIEAALESVRQQSLAALELVVVDDASSDGGEQVVRNWLERHGPRFPRARLLRHRSNGGLAAARNTAFAAVSAPWCFVLDADNLLLPDAVACCLEVAEAAPATAAVVHSLVELVQEGPGGTEPGLISPLSWQRSHFLFTNYIDAMALVRVAAWRQVGGYTHIPGGWEDFDFWCALIDAGLHGVLCPQRLARYTRHGSSMIATTTNRHVRRISRVLQARHPWLTLPMAGQGV